MTEDNILVLKFADSKVPDFKEVSGKDYVLFGEDNMYPYYLLELYNKSAKHNAIINGKVTYIAGNGAKPVIETPQTVAFETRVNRTGESLRELLVKTTKDIEIFGGFYWQVIPNLLRTSFEIYHVPFEKIRVGKDSDCYYYKKKWSRWGNRENEIEYPSFDPTFKGASIFAYKEYRPGLDSYPLPGYLGANNYIETDIEISKYNLSAIKNGMFPSKMIQFFNGEPNTEVKGKMEKDIKKKFTGSEKAGNFFLIFNKNKDQEVKIDDLSATELDKQFDLLNKTCQQEIFSGHQVTSPMLFGIKESGQLGGRDELQNAFDIFKNTYIKDKQLAIQTQLNYVCAQMGFPVEWQMQQVDPIGFAFSDIANIKDIVPKEYILDKIGVDVNQYPTAKDIGIVGRINSLSPLVANKVLESMTADEIRSIVGLQGGVVVPGTPSSVAPETQMVNENLKNLTGRQYQNIQRIVRKYKQGVNTREEAAMMLKNGFGLSDDDINVMLGEQLDFSAHTEQEVSDMFDTIGESREVFSVIRSKPIAFSSDEDMKDYENAFYKHVFAKTSIEDKAILDILSKNPSITPEEIATTLTTTEDYIVGRIADMKSKGILESSDGKISIIKTPPDKVAPTSIQIRYSYEVKPGVGPAVIKTTRPFCKKLVELDKMYSRAEIEQISQRVGYSVFDRAGGFWNNNGTIEDSCRHQWRANVVIKKK